MQHSVIISLGEIVCVKGIGFLLVYKHSFKNYVKATTGYQEKKVPKSYVGFLVQITVLSNARLYTHLHNSYMAHETHTHIHKSFYSQLSTIWEPSNK